MTKSPKPNRSSLVIPIVLIVSGGVIIFFNLTSKINKNASPVERPQIQKTVTKTENEVRVDNIIGTPEKNQKSPSLNIDPETLDSESADVLTKFWLNAKINFPVPRALKYQKINVDSESVIGLHGYRKSDGTDLIILARNLYTQILEIGTFLHETQIGITNESELSPKSFPLPEKTIKLPAITRLQPVKIWRFRGKLKGRVVALANRVDQKGSYLVIYTVPKGNLNRTEEFLIALFKEAVAQ